jgi:hypothetical protein
MMFAPVPAADGIPVRRIQLNRPLATDGLGSIGPMTVDAFVYARRVTADADDRTFDAALRAAVTAIDQAVDVVAATGEPMRQYRLATSVVAVAQQAVTRLSGLRAGSVGRIADAAAAAGAPMSLAQLAATIGVSKPRADQFLRAYRSAAGASDAAVGKEPSMPEPLLSMQVREALLYPLSRLGTLQEIADGFAEFGLPEPVVADGRVNKSPKRKLVTRYFDAIDWADEAQVKAVLELCTRALMRWCSQDGRERDGLVIQRLRQMLASDGYELRDDLRIVPLMTAAPREVPLERIADVRAAFDAAKQEALSAAQAVRTMLSASDDSRPDDFDLVLIWQVRDAARVLLDHPRSADVDATARRAFEQLTDAAVTFLGLAQDRSGALVAVLDQTAAWIAQLVLRAWSQAALELLEVARGHRSALVAVR